MKRIKKVFSSSDQVLHLWANQSQDEARCKNVFFEGNKVYSYGKHYELGRLIQYKGKTVALINAEGYSVTTRKHISQAKSATSHLITLSYHSAPSFGHDGGYVTQALSEKQGSLISQCFDHFSTLRFARWNGGTDQQKFEACKWSEKSDYSLASQIKQFNELCLELGHKEFLLNVTPEFIQDYNDHILKRLQRETELQSPEAEARREKQREQREAAEQRKIEKQRQDALQSIVEWRSGGPLTNAVRYQQPQILRVNGAEVQTSSGASVPLTHAVRLLNMIEQGKAKQGERVGSFTLTEVSGEIVRIGCHSIKLSEAREVLTPFLNSTLKAVNNG